MPPPFLLPTSILVVWTDQLRIGIRGEKKVMGFSTPGFVSEGVDVQVGLHVEGESQRSQLNARLVDAQGMLAGLTALGQVPLRELWQAPTKTLERLSDLPLTAQLTVPRRALDDFPETLRLSGLTWRSGSRGSADRIASRSSRDAQRSRVQRQPASASLALPVDLDVETKYDGEKVETRLYAKRPQGVVLDAVSQIKVRLADLLASKESRPATWWEANGAAHLLNFPLGSIPALADNQVAGLASGTLTFTGINREPAVNGQVDLQQLTIDKASFPHGVALLRVAEGGVLASAKLDQTNGGASVTATARVGWPGAVSPELDTEAPLDLYVEAHDFRAAALYPVLFRGIFTYFDGRLDGTLHLHQEKQKAERVQTVDGTFDLKDGVFQIPQIGQEFSQAKAHIAVVRSGEVQIEDVSANGATGRLTASGTMLLKGFAFVSAEGAVKVAQKESIPMTFEGVSLGQAWGSLALHAKKSDDRTIKLDIDVPAFHTDLPESSSRAVEALGDHPDVKVGVRDREGELLAVLLWCSPGEALRGRPGLARDFLLGSRCSAQTRIPDSSGLERRAGHRSTDEAHISGYINLRSGAVEILGKRFEIEPSSLKFLGEGLGDSQVNFKARWDSPNETRVYGRYLGPLKDLTIHFDSEPRSRMARSSRCFFSETPMTQPPSRARLSRTTTCWSGASAIASMKVNQALSKVTPGVSTRVAADEQSPTPEVAIQLGPKVTAEVSYRTRPPTPGEQPDRVLLTLDWNFRRNWSIGTTVGDRGSSVLDLIWRYRY